MEKKNIMLVIPISKKDLLKGIAGVRGVPDGSGPGSGPRTGKKEGSKYINPDGTFKGGFDGCVKYQMEVKGLAEENAQKLCAHIAKRVKGV